MIFTVAKIFIDTNILLYSLDQHDSKRQNLSRQKLKQITQKDQGVISTQVLQEFYVAAVQKMGVEPLVAKGILASLENFEIVVIQIPLIKDAIDCHILNQISFWDALVVVSAASAKCDLLWTEDLNSGQVIHGVQIENPLK